MYSLSGAHISHVQRLGRNASGYKQCILKWLVERRGVYDSTWWPHWHFSATIHSQILSSIVWSQQAPHAWFEHLVQWGFENSKSDISFFIYNKENVYTLLLMYVNDILVTRMSDKMIKRLKFDLNVEFAIEQLGSLYYSLGIEAPKDHIGLYLS